MYATKAKKSNETRTCMQQHVNMYVNNEKQENVKKISKRSQKLFYDN